MLQISRERLNGGTEYVYYINWVEDGTSEYLAGPFTKKEVSQLYKECNKWCLWT